ncbi:MAG: TonB-dependent receptor plug domain-containing protein, partial [Bacteroidales bacterium]
LLMLTHGWRRFRWTDVLSSTSPVLAHAPTFGTTVSGMLTGPDNLVRNAGVSLRKADEKLQVFTTQTNERGFFLFENLPFTDSVLVEILAPIGAQGVEPGIEILSFGERGGTASDWSYEMNPLTKPQQMTARGRDWSRVRTQRDSESASGSNSPYGRPDQTIYVDQNQPYASVLDILRDKAIGLIISPAGHITVRGPSSIQNQQPPIFIIDGVESQGAFMGAHVRDIDRIDVFRGASTAAFGSRGASGALVAYTKRRDFNEETSPQHMFLVAGLHAPRAFCTDFEMPIPRLEDQQVKTITWEPNLVTGLDGLASFQFLPPSGVGRYRIVIQGIGKDGKVGFGEFLIGN